MIKLVYIVVFTIYSETFQSYRPEILAMQIFRVKYYYFDIPNPESHK